SEKVAIVTGAGTGVGRAAVLALSQDGFSVVLAGGRPEPLEGVAKGGKGPRALGVAPHGPDPAAVKALVAQTEQGFGRLDLLFHHGGLGAAGIPLEDLTFEQWKTVVDINLTGSFLCTQEAFKIMKSQDPRGGRIINNGSISAHVPRPNS